MNVSHTHPVSMLYPYKSLLGLIGLSISSTLFATSVSEVVSYASSIPESVSDSQPSALQAEFNYDDTLSNAPIAVIMHQFSASSGNFSTYRANATRLRDLGFFTIMPAMRGRDGSDGTRDTGGLEIHDILDAVEAAKELYPDLVDPDYVYITGYSGGGGNTMSALTKFPDYWNAAAAFFGMSDYGYDSEDGWYFNGAASSHQSIMDTDIGDPSSSDLLVQDCYYARASNLASLNNPYAEIHLFVNANETTCPPINDQSYKDNAVAEATFTGEFDNITVHTGYADLYEDFNEDGIDTADELQYWVHSTQDADEQSAAEDWFIDRMATKQIPTPVLNDTDELQVAGYVKTSPFALYLGDGQNAVARLNYSLGSQSYEFTLEILSSDNTVPTLLQIDASDHSGFMVDISQDGTLIESIAGGDTIETSALIDGSTVTVTFTETPAPEEALDPILPKSEPIAYWRFESDLSFLDDSAEDNHSLTTGGTAPTYTALPNTSQGEDLPTSIPTTGADNEGAALLSGAGYFTAGNDTSLQPSSFTIEAFVSTTGFGTSTQYIASRYTSSSSNRGWSFGMTGTTSVTGTSDTGELFMVVSADGTDGTVVGSGQTLTAEDDYYVSLSFTAGQAIVFRTMNLSDETPILTTTEVSSPVTTLHNSSSTSFLIGAYNGGNNRWNGLIDEVRISSGALIESHLLITSGLLYQDWLDNFFTSAEQEDPLISGVDADPDNDGLSNLLEFASGTYPTITSTSPLSITHDADQIDISITCMNSPDLNSYLWTTDNLNNTWSLVSEDNLIDSTTEDFIITKTYSYDSDNSPDSLFFKETYELTAE
jgi:alpha/beta superfamily hydrolase